MECSYFTGNYLPLNLKKLYKDVKRFKLKLGEFLSRHSFYTLDEYVGKIDYIQVVFMYSNSLYCHVYRVCVCGSVTNNNTWIRIGYRIYSLWRFITAQITITSF
jgi:hypothetical protein